MPPDVGQKAPDFAGVVTDGQQMVPFQLSDELGHGPVVLGFFPFAYSSTCEAQMCDLRDHLPELEAVDARALGISSDSPYTLKAWHREHQLGFPLVSDYNREALRAYQLGQSLLRGLKDHHKRACFVLDGDGVVTWRWVTEDPDERPAVQEVVAAVETAT